MCGIAGIAGLKDRSFAGLAIERMTDSLSHRGPDAEGHFVEEGIALGHRRLSIIDLSAAADQPLFDPEGRYALIFNGEIYNYKDVAARFPDYAYRTRTDSEVILAAYSALGPGCLELLNGMFAFAVWDSAERTLFLARDRVGVKPLYYARPESGGLVFASEVRSVLASGLIERKLNSHALHDYLMFQSVYSPRTVVEGIHQLPAGHFALYSDGDLRIEQYWNIAGGADSVAETGIDAIRREVRERLLASVECRMVSDVTLGAFLSGGIDSSAIVGLMSEISDEPVTTFSVVFDEPEFDESKYSDLVAGRFRTRHHRIRLTAADFLDALPSALRAMDSPSGDGLNTFVVSKAARDAGITVALSGLGGDELFAGYPNFLSWYRTQRPVVRGMPAVFRRPAAAVLAASASSKTQRLADIVGAETLDLATVYPMLRQVLSSKTAASLCVRSNGDEMAIRATLRARSGDIARFPRLSQYSIGELLGYTQNVLLKDTDQFSMASALEVREPFLDYRLIEYVLGIPDAVKYPRFPKSLLVESLAGLLPDEIVHRPKMGFVLPWRKWMRGELRDFCDTRLKRLAGRGIVDPKRTDAMWGRFLKNDTTVLWSHLWHMVVLDDWLENNGF